MARLSSPPANKGSDEREPVTVSLIQLVLWMSGPPRRSQAALARACGFSQQIISAILLRRHRPTPGGELAETIALVTAGEVPEEGWLLPAEMRTREARREQARHQAARFVSGELVAAPQGRRSVGDLGDAGARLGLDTQPSAGRRPRSGARRRAGAEPAGGALKAGARAVDVPLVAGQPPAAPVERSALAAIDTAVLVAELAARAGASAAQGRG